MRRKETKTAPYPFIIYYCDCMYSVIMACTSIIHLIEMIHSFINLSFFIYLCCLLQFYNGRFLHTIIVHYISKVLNITYLTYWRVGRRWIIYSHCWSCTGETWYPAYSLILFWNRPKLLLKNRNVLQSV